MLYFYARDTMVKVNIFSSTIVSVYGGQGTGHCPAGIFKNIISNVTKNEEAGLSPDPLITITSEN